MKNENKYIAHYLNSSCLFSLLIIGLNSCAPTIYEITQKQLETGNNSSVIEEMKKQLTESPKDADFLKYLGIALYNKKYYGEAITPLQNSYKFEPSDDITVYYLAACYEATFEFPKAIQFYKRYMDLTVFGEYKDLVDARIKLLYKSQMEIEAKKALIEESRLEVDKIPSNSIAVLYFENLGTNLEMNPLQKGLAEMIITDLSKIKSLRVVERIRLQKLMEEMNFGESGIVDDKTASRFGKLLGANRLVKGSFFDITADEVKIDAFVTRTKSGEIDATSEVSGSTNNFFKMEKELVFNLLKEMNIPISNEEREAILMLPTENYFAFLQFSQGLDYEDRGQYIQASQSYSIAVQSDPNFNQAKVGVSRSNNSNKLTSSSSSSSSGSKSSGVTSQPIAAPPSSIDVKQTISSSNDRTSFSQTQIGTGFQPSTGSLTPQAPTLTSPLPEPPRPPN